MMARSIGSLISATDRVNRAAKEHAALRPHKVDHPIIFKFEEITGYLLPEIHRPCGDAKNNNRTWTKKMLQFTLRSVESNVWK